MSVSCAGCGGSNPPGSRFCNGCGRPLAAFRSFRSPDAYTPPHLVQRILTSKSAIAGERKQVTVLFCDISNSTRLAEQVGADAMHELLNRFFEIALAEVHRYEGTVNQFLGDGFMALFGAPIAHEDHARRAVLAALGIRKALQERRQSAATSPRLSIDVRMGLNTGNVVVGAIGDNLRMDYTAIGNTTNLAARLQQIAAPGEINLSEATWRLVEPHVESERLGERAVKGKTEPVLVYRLTAERKRAEPTPAGPAAMGSDLVGRDKEMSTLAETLARLRDGDLERAEGILRELGALPALAVARQSLESLGS